MQAEQDVRKRTAPIPVCDDAEDADGAHYFTEFLGIW